jgi:branched-chain amino acid transport system ATP-binding protein
MRRSLVLKVENIAVCYQDVQALMDVSLEVPEGEIVGLLGPNAAGKSTTLRSISGLVKVRSGRITFGGKEIQNSSAHSIVELGLIHVPEGRGLFGTLTVMENLELGAYTVKARSLLKQNMERVFETFPILKKRQGQMAGSLSGGEQQMCAVARGLMAEPQLLMIDEMSLGLAPLLVKQMFVLVRQIASSGYTILLVEQQIRQALKLANRGFILENGATVLSGTASDLVENEHIKRVYLGL